MNNLYSGPPFFLNHKVSIIRILKACLSLMGIIENMLKNTSNTQKKPDLKTPSYQLLPNQTQGETKQPNQSHKSEVTITKSMTLINK